MCKLRFLLVLISLVLIACDDGSECVDYRTTLSRASNLLEPQAGFGSLSEEPSQGEYGIKWTQVAEVENWEIANVATLIFMKERPGIPSEINIPMSNLGSTGRAAMQVRFSDPGTTYTAANGVTYTVMKSTQVNYPTLPGGTTYFSAIMTESTKHPEHFSALATGAEEFSFEAKYIRPAIINEHERLDYGRGDQNCFTGLSP